MGGIEPEPMFYGETTTLYLGHGSLMDVSPCRRMKDGTDHSSPRRHDSAFSSTVISVCLEQKGEKCFKDPWLDAINRKPNLFQNRNRVSGISTFLLCISCLSILVHSTPYRNSNITITDDTDTPSARTLCRLSPSPDRPRLHAVRISRRYLSQWTNSLTNSGTT